MYDNLILIHTPPVEHQENTVTIHTVLSVPKFLKAALYLKDYKVWMESEDGLISAPLGSVIGYEKSEKTYSGYNCWPIGCLGSDLIRIDGLLYRNPYVAYGMLIPGPNDHIAFPLWVQRCKLVYNEDGRLDHIYSCFQENLKELESRFYYIKVLFSRVLENSIFLV